MFPTWGRRFLNRVSRKRSVLAQLQRPRFRPELAELEPRIVPSQAPLTPPEIASAYGFNQIKLPGGYAANGQGQTIAIIEIGYTAPSVINASLTAFDAGDAAQGLGYTLPAPPNVQEVDLSNGTDAGSEEETLLDVEWAHALAPAASLIVFEAAPGSTDAQTLANFMTAVQDATAYNGPLGQVSVVSMSYGFPETEVPSNLLSTYDAMFTTPANHVGITFLAASGDDGAGEQSRFGGIEPPNYPASSPNVVGVGGTTLIVPSSDTAFTYPGVATTAGGAGESAWGVGNLSYDRFDSPGGGSGGGISTVEAEPAYQVSAGLAFSNGKTNGRTSPDVSFDADALNSPVLFYDSFDTNQFGQPIGWTAIGGTSFGAPAWSALVAIADEARAVNNEGTLDGATQTLPMLYKLSNNDFHDITQGSDGYSAAAGYDLATGLGTPVASRVVGDLWGQTPPTAKGDSYTVNENSSLTVTAGAGVLANDTDPLGEPLVVSAFTQAGHGFVAMSANGSFTYQPTTGFAGVDTFTYSILDTGTGVVSTATVTIAVEQGPADLAPFTPSGWSGPLVVTTQSGSTTAAATITTAQTVFVDWSFINQGGLSISTPFQTELLLNGTQVQTWQASVPLNAGGTIQSTGFSLGQLAAGTYTVTVITDFTNQVTESNKNNNTETVTFTVIAPPLPDLAPTTPTGWSGPLVVSTQTGDRTTAGSFTISDNVYVNWAFINQSITPIANSFGVELLLDGTQVQTWSFNGLGANASQNETDINLGELAAGTHTITVIADNTNQVTESNENNNTETYTFTVTQQALPDLAPFTPTGWSGPLVVTTLSTGTTTATAIATTNTIYIDWAFINRGSADINTPFQTELLVDGHQVTTWTTSLAVPQSYYTFVTGYDLGQLSAGSHTITVIANYLNQVAEGSTDNNTETYTFTVTPPGLPDLAPYTPSGWSASLVVTTRSNSTTTSATITTANSVFIDWSFINQGSSVITTNYQTELLLDGQQIKTWSASVPLNPNFFSFISGFDVGQLAAGQHTITVITDYLNQVTESDETNNTETYTFTVVQPPLPDLAPITPSGWSGPLVLTNQANGLTAVNTISSTDTAYIDWAFVNQGNATINSSFRTELLLDGNLVNTWVTTPPLSPTIYYYVLDYDIGQLSAGSHTLTVITDYLNQIDESDKTNDTETITFTVVAPPTITTQPGNQTVSAGGTATFNAAATGSPTPTVQWQISSNGGATFGNINGATSTTLNLPVTADMNGDEVQAVFTNSAGSETTDAAKLTVGAPPAITSVSSLNLVADSPGSFTVTATGEPAPTFQESGALPKGMTFNSATGVLSGTPTSFGTFSITFTASNGVSPAATQNFTLTVSGIPAFATSLDERFVAQMYLDLLDRVVDQSALTFWSGELDQGALTRTQVAQQLMASAEYRTDEIQTLYQKVLNRAADPGAVTGWLGYLTAGGNGLGLEAQLLGSQEYFENAGGGTNSGFLSALYQTLLGRAIDSGSLAVWSQALQTGASRTAVATAVMNSSESLARIVSGSFQQFLRRSPTATEQTTYVAQLQAGITDEQISAALVGSAEYAQNSGGDANQAYVANLFTDLLGRAADPGSLTYFTGQLDSGAAARQQIVQILLASSEYENKVVQGIFQTYLHRAADPTALQSLSASLAAGASDESVAALVIGSQEFFQDNGSTNDGFLTALFHDVLGRTLDSSSKAYFEGELAAGVSRTQVADQIFASSEYLQDEVNNVYEKLLNRAADPSGLSAFVKLLQSGGKEESVIAALAVSAEYFAKT